MTVERCGNSGPGSAATLPICFTAGRKPPALWDCLPKVVGIRDGSKISRPCDSCTWFPFMLSFGTGTVQFPSFLEVDSADRWNDWLHGAHLRKTIEYHTDWQASVVHAVNMNQHPSWYLMSVQLYRIIPYIYIYSYIKYKYIVVVTVAQR